ncbi:hypothetical protein Nos7524_4819 [Nostoc sp. PCC 7524]|uniref:hypothetical protein n=1 Tax=Nostoc sp. (strain ATCC 29411 / PCC 7524) TaxID=28072 RepID=UPI00029EE150|nr:hypothetical protein [Nostoc sp. PCC 7524]AFY50556.1 hypothetical protein Nos7524_4819 [Nostoc sp. PCC 7524]
MFFVEKPKYFEEGNYIYECKSSPDHLDEPINQNSLKKWINDVKKLLRKKQPSGFRYIFPVNRLDSNNCNLLEQLKAEFPNIDIQYYDCDSVDRLVKNLQKVNSLPELVEYIKQARN